MNWWILTAVLVVVCVVLIVFFNKERYAGTKKNMIEVLCFKYILWYAECKNCGNLINMYFYNDNSFCEKCGNSLSDWMIKQDIPKVSNKEAYTKAIATTSYGTPNGIEFQCSCCKSYLTDDPISEFNKKHCKKCGRAIKNVDFKIFVNED